MRGRCHWLTASLCNSQQYLEHGPQLDEMPDIQGQLIIQGLDGDCDNDIFGLVHSSVCDHLSSQTPHSSITDFI